MTVMLTHDGNVALITIARPPVNGLDAVTRKELAAAFVQASGDVRVAAIVITGGSKLFSAGADIEEFAQGLTGPVLAEPTLPDLINRIEGGDKPVIAAIAGICMGGGLELALGCHHRIADGSARFALPEVKLGILPGAGGTQRLPRAIGVADALTLITTGEVFDCARAAALGLTAIAPGELLPSAIELARQVAGNRDMPRISRQKAMLPAGETVDAYFAKRLAALRRPGPAMRRCVDAVRLSVEMPFAEALRREFDFFKELVETPESKALQYAFFSERLAARIAGAGKDTVTRSIRRVAVIGAGTMGSGIAMCAANAGLPVVLIDQAEAAVARGLATISGNYAATVRKGRMTQEALQQRMALVTTATQLSAVSEADLIIEAVFEDMAVKQSIFRELDGFARHGAILASNTSTLDLNEIASATRRPQDVVGLHFFSPANVMRLLEVIRGAHTSLEVLASAMSFAKRIGKVGVIAGVCDGFIGNRMFEEYLRQAYFLLDEGVTPWRVDAALEKWGFAMGPFAVMDLAGQDIGRAIRERRAIEQPHRPYSGIPDRVCKLGRFGQKTGAGFYRYDPATRARQPDPEIEALIRDYVQEHGIAQRIVEDDEIVARCVLALVNEGALLLEQGFAQRGSDIDVVWLNGYGFPAHYGGPMFHADQLGLDRVIARMTVFGKGYHAECWQIAPLLHHLVAGKLKLSAATAPTFDSFKERT